MVEAVKNHKFTIRLFEDTIELETLKQLTKAMAINLSKNEVEFMNWDFKIKMDFIQYIIDILKNNLDYTTKYLNELGILAIDFEIYNNKLRLSYFIDTEKLTNFLSDVGNDSDNETYIKNIIMSNVREIITKCDNDYMI